MSDIWGLLAYRLRMQCGIYCRLHTSLCLCPWVQDARWHWHSTALICTEMILRFRYDLTFAKCCAACSRMNLRDWPPLSMTMRPSVSGLLSAPQKLFRACRGADPRSALGNSTNVSLRLLKLQTRHTSFEQTKPYSQRSPTAELYNYKTTPHDIGFDWALFKYRIALFLAAHLSFEISGQTWKHAGSM